MFNNKLKPAVTTSHWEKWLVKGDAALCRPLVVNIMNILSHILYSVLNVNINSFIEFFLEEKGRFQK